MVIIIWSNSRKIYQYCMSYDKRFTIYLVFTGTGFLPLEIKHCIFRPRLGPNDLFQEETDARFSFLQFIMVANESNVTVY